MLTADKVLTFAVSAPVTLSFWPSGPVKNMTCLQGDSLLDPAEYSELADKDVVIFQSFYPTVARLQSRINAINAIRALQVGKPQTKRGQIISGTPTAAVTSNVTVRASD